MSQRFGAAFALLLCGLGLRAQSGPTEHCYAGRLGDYPVEALLQGGTDGPLSGRYFYESQRKEIQLEGATEGGRIRLRESVNGQTTGNWLGERDNFSFRGTWTSPKGKELAFQLYPVGCATYLNALGCCTLADIQDKRLRAIAALYTEVSLPFSPSFEGEDERKELPAEALTYVFADTSELSFYNAVYPGQVFFQPDYFGLVTLHNYSPGAFGINNSYLRLATFRYDGRAISQVELGCDDCSDTNLGAGDYYSTRDECVIKAGRITCHRVEEHGSMNLDEEQEEFLETKNDTLYFHLHPDGMVVPE